MNRQHNKTNARIYNRQYKRLRKQGLSINEVMCELKLLFVSADGTILFEDSESTITSSSSGSESPPPISSPSDGDSKSTISSGSESPPPISSPSDTSTNRKDCTDQDDLNDAAIVKMYTADLNDAISDDDDMPELLSEQESRSYEVTMSNRSSGVSESSPISSKSNEDDAKRRRRDRCRKMNGKRYRGGYYNWPERQQQQQQHNRDKRHERQHERQQRKKNYCKNYCTDCKCSKALCRGISSGCANQKHSRW